MRNLAVIELVTLDGVMQSVGSPDEDREGGFDYGGWSAPCGDEVLGKAAGEGMATTTAYLFGRKTYQHMVAHWPGEPDTNPIAAHLNATPKYVVTRTLASLERAGSHVLGGDVATSVNDLKQHGTAPSPCLLVSYFLRRQPAVPGQQRRWRHGEDLGPAPARHEPRQRGEPGPVARLIPHPARVPPQYRILMPEHQQLSILRQVAAEHQDGQAEHPSRRS